MSEWAARRDETKHGARLVHARVSAQSQLIARWPVDARRAPQRLLPRAPESERHAPWFSGDGDVSSRVSPKIHRFQRHTRLSVCSCSRGVLPRPIVIAGRICRGVCPSFVPSRERTHLRECQPAYTQPAKSGPMLRNSTRERLEHHAVQRLGPRRREARLGRALEAVRLSTRGRRHFESDGNSQWATKLWQALARSRAGGGREWGRHDIAK